MTQFKKVLKAKEPVSLRFKVLSKGSKSLYLDTYWNGTRHDTSDWNTATYTLEDKVNGKVVTGAAANYRIGLYTKPFASKEEAFKALERENRAEFGMDGHRWFDLARWGLLKEEMDSFGKFENAQLGSSKYQPYQTNAYTFPIPQTQIQTSEGRIKQNVNWQ